MDPLDLHFDRFVLRPGSRELLADGHALRLGARAFDLLLALARRPGEVLTRDELFECAWPGRVVVDDNLKVQVMALRKLLGNAAIVTVPRRGYRFGLAVVAKSDAAASMSRPSRPGTGLIGRDEELSSVLDHLAPGCLLTIVGSGGMGKTRLALAAAEQAGARFTDGRCAVELASLADPALLPAAVAHALQLPSTGSLTSAASVASALQPLALLLVLDNCEHLRAEAALFAQAVLECAPQVALLATSQEPLGLREEHLLRLAGLRWPEPAALESGADLDALRALPAVVLFCARVAAADGRFVLDRDNAGAVAAICRQLEGMPLALELAAARVPLLGVGGVLARLDQHLRLLTKGAADAPARQQTLRGALQWSHALLDDTQKSAFRRLGVFADGFSFAGAVQVVGPIGTVDVRQADADPEWAVLDTLDVLVAKSLLQTQDVAGQRRYRLLVTARAFALERLADSGESAATQRRHAQAVLALFNAAHDDLLGAPLLPWIDRLWIEVPDLRAALRWAAGPGGDASLLLGLVSAAGPFWAAANLDAEAAPWLQATRKLVDACESVSRRARYWQAVALRVIDPTTPVAEAVAAAERAADLFAEAGDTRAAYRMLGIVVQHGRRVQPQRDVRAVLERMRTMEAPGWTELDRRLRARAESIVLARSGDWTAYRDRFAHDAALLAENGDEMRVWGCLHHVALAEMALGRPERAVEVTAPVVQRLRELGLTRQQWTRPALLMMARIEAGAAQEMAPLLREVLTLLRVAGAPAWSADHLAWWAVNCGAHEEAARLLGWADTGFEPPREPRHSHAQSAATHTLAHLQGRLAPDRLEALRREGRSLGDTFALQRVLALA
ncbi:MAG: winged helix-turn-helix domain-containing protein [Pseudomonadota bacterium]